MAIEYRDGLYLPRNEDELRDLIQRAVRENLKIRVRGSAHSVPGAIYTGNFEIPPPHPNDPDINIYLSNMMNVTFFTDDKGHQFARAQAGCHLGKDPDDPLHTSTEKNSLCYQMDQRGLSVADTGGIIHQTVAGFLSTGSCGGSIAHVLEPEIEEIRLIDGTGTLHVINRQTDPDTLNAVGVSLGLMGIITEVTFRCQANFTIRGTETTYTYKSVPIDMFGEGNGKPLLVDFLRSTDYARIYWWPHKGVEKFTVWQASIAEQPAPAGKQNYQPYDEFPLPFGARIPIFSSLFEGFEEYVARWLFLFFAPLNPPSPKTFLGQLRNKILGWLFPHAINAFISPEIDKPQNFYDIWYGSLPMDNKVNYRLLPIEFTELWVKVGEVPKVMQVLRDYYAQNGFPATGTNTVEIYATRHSPFWLSASYGDQDSDDVVKIDMFWFGDNPGNPGDTFYPQFWELLKPYRYRPHWGKYQAVDPTYLQAQYPKWQEFMNLRASMDPHQIFVTDYWRERLAIPKPSVR